MLLKSSYLNHDLFLVCVWINSCVPDSYKHTTKYHIREQQYINSWIIILQNIAIYTLYSDFYLSIACHVLLLPLYMVYLAHLNIWILAEGFLKVLPAS